MTRTAGSILAWIYGLFSMVVFGLSLSVGLGQQNALSVPALLFTVAGAVYCYVGYGLATKQRSAAIIGAVLSGYVFLMYLGIGLGLVVTITSPYGRFFHLGMNGGICFSSVLSSLSSD